MCSARPMQSTHSQRPTAAYVVGDTEPQGTAPFTEQLEEEKSVIGVWVVGSVERELGVCSASASIKQHP